MTQIKFKESKNTYKSVNMAPSKDKRLSFKARGVLYYLIGMSDGWKGQVFNIINASEHDGKSSVQSALKELRDCGYAKLVTPSKQDGKFVGKYYEISDKPIFKS